MSTPRSHDRDPSTLEQAARLARSAPQLLLAEDDPDDRAALAAALRLDGYEIVEVPSARELMRRILHFVIQGRVPPDVIVAGPRMPRYTLLQSVRAFTGEARRPRLVLLRSAADAAEDRELERLGADALLDCRADMETVRRSVAEVMMPR